MGCLNDQMGESVSCVQIMVLKHVIGPGALMELLILEVEQGLINGSAFQKVV